MMFNTCATIAPPHPPQQLDPGGSDSGERLSRSTVTNLHATPLVCQSVATPYFAINAHFFLHMVGWGIG